MTQPNPTNEIPARVASTSHRMLDAIDHILDRLTPVPHPTPPAAVRRRQIANIVRTSQFCPRSTCRRSGACRGEPLHCLQVAIPLLPPEAFDGILTPPRPRRRR